MTGDGGGDGVRRLRAAFVRLVAFETAAVVFAVIFLIGYFVFQLSWCLPAFAAVLMAAAAAQVVFISRFRKSYSGGA